MKKIYCISGLGADHRLFGKLSIPGYELIPMPWLPFDTNDDMVSYASKMATLINDKAAIIIGLSFGGMLATEIAKTHPDYKAFLVSSAKIVSEIKIHGGAVSKWLIRSMIVPPSLLNIPSFTTLRYLGAITKEEKTLLSLFIRDSDGRFMKWALKAIATWKNKIIPPNVIHIHGTADKTIPSAGVHPDYWIEGGSHIMIYNRASDIGRIISDCLRSDGKN